MRFVGLFGCVCSLFAAIGFAEQGITVGVIVMVVALILNAIIFIVGMVE